MWLRILDILGTGTDTFVDNKKFSIALKDI